MGTLVWDEKNIPKFGMRKTVPVHGFLGVVGEELGWEVAIGHAGALPGSFIVVRSYPQHYLFRILPCSFS